MNTPRLETERLILRKFEERDIDDMLPFYGDEEVNRFLPYFPLKTREEVSSYLYDQILPCYEKEIAYNYAISLKGDDRVVGYIHVNDLGGSNDMGYALHRDFWNRGLTAEACRAVIGQLKRDGAAYVTATHDVNNPRSGRVMEKLGMTYRYSYEEQWQPKNLRVVFRMYQLNLDGNEERVYTEYWKRSAVHFIEDSTIFRRERRF